MRAYTEKNGLFHTHRVTHEVKGLDKKTKLNEHQCVIKLREKSLFYGCVTAYAKIVSISNPLTFCSKPIM